MRGEGKKLARAAQLYARGELLLDGEDAADEQEVAAALAAFGLKAVEPQPRHETFSLWPDCLPAFQLWLAVQTQWCVKPTGGALGLDYAGVEACMRLRSVPEEERAGLFGELQVMEVAALNEWAAMRREKEWSR